MVVKYRGGRWAMLCWAVRRYIGVSVTIDRRVSISAKPRFSDERADDYDSSSHLFPAIALALRNQIAGLVLQE